MQQGALYIGLMSGTSMDGIDAVLARIHDRQVQVQAHACADFDPALRAELLALNSAGGTDELHRAALAANSLARSCGALVRRLLAQEGLAAEHITAIGAHGQTVRHQPGMHDGTGYTLQLNNPALLAEETGIDVVADFRSRDVAAGGQGAPLVPAFHAALFSRPHEAVAVLNLGGIANLSLLPPGEDHGTPVRGFDCGPANALLDHWAQRHLGQAYDAQGAWAAGGKVDTELLALCLQEPYFALPLPKSTGRDLFHAQWLDARLAQLQVAPGPQDVQATLAELTARSCAEALLRHAPQSQALLVCGGGARNADLMDRLRRLLPATPPEPTDAHGLPAQQVEATAFAWLAHLCLSRVAGNLPAVTGARGLRVLGALHPR
ncbi:anhydro-N-acetylmuramic acid kinase [Xenophilus arseniciresistens]|uniref:Anhydro-N-acetylmuramic acid kinase n=1 Tax=Xenophilus arseniciresistens TaxID=1283306 RepID=A0AAE3N871_9BURK|nr:anhydro-N-acetylmuramic acid kinase [Xenophilus arseniciresistens]MDA7416881.1 anhydro-N-acetylmuramic acid kinase [Xenophilus arseniciresistens]